MLTAPEGSTNCCPDVQKATATEFLLVNPNKPNNFIIGELVLGGQVSFIVENLPRTVPPTGCPGKWMFQKMLEHFGAGVTAIQGNWVGGASDNLAAVNRLTAGGAMIVEDASKLTWTGRRADEAGFSQVELRAPPLGTPGNYVTVLVLFKR